MKYNFNWSAVSGGAPYVTISSTQISFNSTSVEKLNSPEKIVIGFDEENCVIGVKAYTHDMNTKPYQFSEKVKNGCVRINCKDFIRYLKALSDMDFSPSKKFVATYDAENEILIVKVKGGFENDNDDKTVNENEQD